MHAAPKDETWSVTQNVEQLGARLSGTFRQRSLINSVLLDPQNQKRSFFLTNFLYFQGSQQYLSTNRLTKKYFTLVYDTRHPMYKTHLQGTHSRANERKETRSLECGGLFLCVYVFGSGYCFRGTERKNKRTINSPIFVVLKMLWPLFLNLPPQFKYDHMKPNIKSFPTSKNTGQHFSKTHFLD